MPEPAASSQRVCYAAIFVAILFVVIAVPIYVLVTHSSSSPEGLTNVVSLYDTYKACSSMKCKEVRGALFDVANRSANPCENFYAYACGSWTGRNKDTANQTEDIYSDYLARVHAKLEEGQVEGATTRPERAMISMHRGCMEFMKGKEFSLSKITGMLQLDPKTWLAIGSVEEVMLQFMNRNFLYGLDLLVKIELNDGVVSVEAGKTLTTFFGPDTTAMLNWTLHELGESNKLSETTGLENTLNAMATTSKNVPSDESYFSKMPKNWEGSLLRELRKSSAEPIDVVRVDPNANVRLMLNAMYKESLSVVRLFTLLCLVAPFVQFKYDRMSALGNGDHTSLYCLRAVGWFIPQVLSLWIAKNVQHPSASREAQRMALIITDIATSNSSSTWRFPLPCIDVESLKLYISGSKSLVSYVSEDFPEQNVNEGDFIEMSAWAMRKSQKLRKASKFPWEWQLSTHLLLFLGNRIVVPASRLGGDWFQLDTEELSINFGTLGVQLARGILKGVLGGSSLSGDGPELTTVRKCVREVGETLTRDQEGEIAEFLWAVKVAHEYIETGGRDVNGIQSWLFFMRLCRSMCEKEGPNASWAHLRCNYASLASSSFDAAFNCSRKRHCT